MFLDGGESRGRWPKINSEIGSFQQKMGALMGAHFLLGELLVLSYQIVSSCFLTCLKSASTLARTAIA